MTEDIRGLFLSHSVELLYFFHSCILDGTAFSGPVPHFRSPRLLTLSQIHTHTVELRRFDVGGVYWALLCVNYSDPLLLSPYCMLRGCQT